MTQMRTKEEDLAAIRGRHEGLPTMQHYHDDVLTLIAVVEQLRAENDRLIRSYADNQKANIASRRSLCEQSDRYLARAVAAELASAAVTP